jgi:hypothetical protein
MSKNSGSPLQRGAGLPNFKREHWEKDAGETAVADGRYCTGEMDNPEHLKKSVNELAGYVKRNKMSYP